jgi:hypothetical protein
MSCGSIEETAAFNSFGIYLDIYFYISQLCMEKIKLSYTGSLFYFYMALMI